MNPSLRAREMRWLQPPASKLLSWISLILVVIATGCDPLRRSTTGNANPSGRTDSEIATTNRVAAQGRLLPETGIVRLAAIPGDRIEKILVKVGDDVTAGQSLARMVSESLRESELNIAKQRLQEAEAQADSRRVEADLATEAATVQVSISALAITQALAQGKLVNESKLQVDQVRKQLERIEELRAEPLTHDLISQVELEQKRIDVDQMESRWQQSRLAAQQAHETANLTHLVAEQRLVAAKRSRTLIDALVPTESLKQQISLLELQRKQSLFLAPKNGQVLAILSQEGELAGPTPIVEMADLKSMVCWTEVHEADVARIQMGNVAEIRSSALARALKGTIYRIDSMVGSPQLRIPNPLAKTDFRAIPVWIRLNEADSQLAARFVQMQVDVTIQTEPAIEHK